MDFPFSNDLNFSSVEQQPGLEARAAFTVNSQSVFRVTDNVALPCREHTDIVPTLIDDKLSYIPWGGDNQPSAHRPNGR